MGTNRYGDGMGKNRRIQRKYMGTRNTQIQSKRQTEKLARNTDKNSSQKIIGRKKPDTLYPNPGI